jgi:hypothetical protein
MYTTKYNRGEPELRALLVCGKNRRSDQYIYIYIYIYIYMYLLVLSIYTRELFVWVGESGSLVSHHQLF